MEMNSQRKCTICPWQALPSCVQWSNSTSLDLHSPATSKTGCLVLLCLIKEHETVVQCCIKKSTENSMPSNIKFVLCPLLMATGALALCLWCTARDTSPWLLAAWLRGDLLSGYRYAEANTHRPRFPVATVSSFTWCSGQLGHRHSGVRHPCHAPPEHWDCWLIIESQNAAPRWNIEKHGAWIKQLAAYYPRVIMGPTSMIYWCKHVIFIRGEGPGLPQVRLRLLVSAN